jgi:hypothetical protein
MQLKLWILLRSFDDPLQLISTHQHSIQTPYRFLSARSTHNGGRELDQTDAIETLDYS